jgi:putative heme iron utilization protein
LTLTRVARPAPARQPSRFLARHPSAAGYAHFADFSMYELEIARGTTSAASGRITDLQPARFRPHRDAQVPADGADIIAHMNSDHADTLTLCATELAGQHVGACECAG